MQIPKRIDPCPIVESIIELRFDTDTPPDAIFGIVFNAFKNTYPNLNRLPILQLPETIRTTDPNLQHRPYYQLRNGNFILQIGPTALSLSNTGTYVGWEIFRPKILEAFGTIRSIDIIKKPQRLGIRYINFFDFDIFKKINLELLMKSIPLKTKTVTLRTEIKSNDFLDILQITNDAIVGIDKNKKKGSVIDIDIICDLNGVDFFKSMHDILESGHLEEKTLFFKLLNDDYLKSLNPIY